MPAIDALSIQRKLKDAGFADAQATALTDVMREVVSGYAATKGDLDRLEHELETRIGALRDELTVRFGVMLVAASLLFLALEYTPG